MFTGIIEKKSKILSIENGTFTLENPFGDELELWQSIAHDGACMTVDSYDANSYQFFVMEESFSKTNFSEKKQWDFFNIERCLKVSDRIDGHFVSGHVDTTGKIESLKRNDDDSLLLGISFPQEHSAYTIEKWSIAINGVSLTIVDKKPWYISVSLIPLTQDWTNLWKLIVWQSVNIEFDLLWKYILNK